MYHYSPSALVALLQVVLIDITLAGDNAVVIGMAAARVPKGYRRLVIVRGLAGAVILRIILASFAMSLLNLLGLTLAGGILLLWVTWRAWRDLVEARSEEAGLAALEANGAGASVEGQTNAPSRKSLRTAVLQIVLADASMSLDNVLAVAGAARGHYWVLVLGLVLSIALMGVAVNFVARMLRRYPFVSYAGLVIVLYVAITMIIQGWHQLMRVI